MSVTDFIVDGGNERGFLFEKPISEHFAINGKMKTKHIRLCVWNTKNRLERKYERFSYIQNWEIRDNILKSKKGERQRTEAILKYCKIEDDYFLTKSADGEKILKLIKNKIRQSRKILSRKIEHFFD